MKFKCDCCRREINYDPIKMGGAFPPGWGMHTIKGKKFLLCDGCGCNSSFIGGLSWDIKDMLKRHGINSD